MENNIDGHETEQFIENHVSRRFICDGVPAFEDRTKEEKVKYCRRINSFYLGLDGVSFTREKACHVFKGDVVCESCLSYRKHKRTTNYVERLTAVKDSALSFTTVTSKKDLENFTRAARRRGHEIMALPVSADHYEKIVFVDGYFNHCGEFGELKRINYNDAVELVSSYASLFSDMKVSGNMGKVLVDEEPENEYDLIDVNHRIILFSGKNPSYYQNSLAYAMAIKSFGQNSIATEENIQALVTERENVLIEAYKAIGLFPFFGKTAESKKYRIDEITSRWMYMDGGTSGVHGNLDSLDKFTRELVQEITKEYSDAISSIDFTKIAKLSMKRVAGKLKIDDPALFESEIG